MDINLKNKIDNWYINFINNNKNVIMKLIQLGILKTGETNCQDHNVGESNYAKHIIQPWHIWQEWKLNPWDADIVKRILRTKSTDDRVLDYQKIIHICEERIRQIEIEREISENNGIEEIIK